jgi:hypothetical protein
MSITSDAPTKYGEYGFKPANATAPLAPSNATINGPNSGPLQHAAASVAAMTVPMLAVAVPATLELSRRTLATLRTPRRASQAGALDDSGTSHKPLGIVVYYRLSRLEDCANAFV